MCRPCVAVSSSQDVTLSAHNAACNYFARSGCHSWSCKRKHSGVYLHVSAGTILHSNFTGPSLPDLTQANQHFIDSLCRYGNPTTRVVEEKIRELEGAEDCLVSSSGMNSATTMMLALVPAGGHIVTTTDCYRRTRSVADARSPTRLARLLLPNQGPMRTLGPSGPVREFHRWQAATLVR